MKFKYISEEFDRGIVYVKEVTSLDLPDRLRKDLSDVGQLFGVYDAAGSQLAVVTDRKLAYLLARENELEPVSIH